MTGARRLFRMTAAGRKDMDNGFLAVRAKGNAPGGGKAAVQREIHHIRSAAAVLSLASVPQRQHQMAVRDQIDPGLPEQKMTVRRAVGAFGERSGKHLPGMRAVEAEPFQSFGGEILFIQLRVHGEHRHNGDLLLSRRVGAQLIDRRLPPES